MFVVVLREHTERTEIRRLYLMIPLASNLWRWRPVQPWTCPHRPSVRLGFCGDACWVAWRKILTRFRAWNVVRFVWLHAAELHTPPELIKPQEPAAPSDGSEEPGAGDGVLLLTHSDTPTFTNNQTIWGLTSVCLFTFSIWLHKNNDDIREEKVCKIYKTITVHKSW